MHLFIIIIKKNWNIQGRADDPFSFSFFQKNELFWTNICQNHLEHPNPTHKKTKIRTANKSETTNSKPPGRIIMIDHSETQQGATIRSYFIILL
jgi:hypothetical protein